MRMSHCSSACSNATFSYTPTGTIPGGTTYAWAAPTLDAALTGGSSGAGSVLTDNLSNTTASAATATYSVTATSASCGGSIFIVTVTVNPAAIIASNGTTACSAVAFSYTPSGTIPAGTTYAWSSPTLGTGLTGGVSGSGSSIVTDNLTNTTSSPAAATYSV